MLIPSADAAPQSHRVGPFDVVNRPDELTLRLENRGSLSLLGCALLAFTMLGVLALGILSVVQTSEMSASVHSFDEPDSFFAPTKNHFGFLWLLCSALMLVGVPLYVKRAYKAALTFTFRRSDDAFLRDNRLVTRLRRVENLTICETKDADSKYLYLLQLVYGDGHKMLLHNGYDEREVMNLANEIGAFVGKPVLWR